MIEPRYARAESILKDTIALLLPPSRMALSESAKEVLYVNNGGGNMIPFDLTLTPYMKGPMDCAIGPEARKYSSVIFAGPARTGKTAANIMGSLAHIISRAPGTGTPFLMRWAIARAMMAGDKSAFARSKVLALGLGMDHSPPAP